MKYVLDSNISLKWVLTETDSDKARRLRSEFQNQIHELLAPDVFPVEVAHGLAKAERRGVVPQGGADRLLTNVLSTTPHSSIPICPCSRERSTLPPRLVSACTIASSFGRVFRSISGLGDRSSRAADAVEELTKFSGDVLVASVHEIVDVLD